VTAITASRPARRSALRVQADVLGALLMREIITRYGRHNLGFLWLVAEPMVFTLGIATLWSQFGHLRSAGFSVVEFAVTGYSSVLLWRNCANRCVHAVEPNLSLLYHRNVRVLDIFLARCLLEIAGATGSITVLTLVFTAAGLMQLPADPLQVLAAWLLLAWLGAALGALLGGLSARWDVVERLWHPASYLLFPLSGAVFMVEWLPHPWGAQAPMLPMVSALEMLRGGWFGPSARVHFDAGYVVVFNLVASLLALAVVRDAARRVQPQ
jgi:capsular polysaccharide transport system permease protein